MSGVAEKDDKRFIVLHCKCDHWSEQGRTDCRESMNGSGGFPYVLYSCPRCYVSIPKFMTRAEADKELAYFVSRDFPETAYIFELVKTEHPQA